jgi:taurine dioxygenase
VIRSRLSNRLGIALEGVDLRTLDDAGFRAVEQTWFDGQLLVVKRQTLTPGEFLAFARRFGPPEPHVIDQFHYPDHPDILILSNRRDAAGAPLGLADAAATSTPTIPISKCRRG